MKLLSIIFIVLALSTLILAEKDGLKVTLKFKLDKRLTDSQLDSDPFWGFAGTLVKNIHTYVTDIFPELVLDANTAEWHTNKRELHLYTFLTHDQKKTFDDYDDLLTKSNKKVLVNKLNELLVSQNQSNVNTVTDTEVIDEKFKAKCFHLDPDAFDDDCYELKPGKACTDDDDCVFFSICDFNGEKPVCSSDTQCTDVVAPHCLIDNTDHYNNICVECVTDAHCPEATVCTSSNKCGTEGGEEDDGEDDGETEPMIVRLSRFTLLQDETGVCTKRLGANSSLMHQLSMIAGIVAILLTLTLA